MMQPVLTETEVERVMGKARELLAHPECVVSMEMGTKDATRPGDAISKMEYDGSYTLTISIPPEDE